MIDEIKEERLWGSSIFVFDSSALLDLYYLPRKTRNKLYKEVFDELRFRLWIPSHVEYEYLKNREKTIPKPVKEKYEPLKSKIEKIRQIFNKEILNKVDEISKETSKDDKHPHIDQLEISRMKIELESFKKRIKHFEKNILTQINLAEKEIIGVSDNDDVLFALEKHFDIGRQYSFDEIIEITKEGKHRFEFKIPPGYGDFYKKEKKGTQIFGDLIIWKQILEFSKEKKLPIIFILNDIKKDNDWCYLDNSATEDRILMPREELIKEIKDYSDVEFWMYNLPQFFFFANKYLESKFTEETIQNISQHLNNKGNSGDYLKFRCNWCHEINSYHKSNIELDFEWKEGSLRSMGLESRYEAIENYKCNCKNSIVAKFNLWEYPTGVHNNDSTELLGAALISTFSFTIDFDIYNEENENCICHKCSGNNSGGGNYIELSEEVDLNHEYDSNNFKYSSTKGGGCTWCGTFHLKCPKCGNVNGIEVTDYDEKIECENSCGLMFFVESSMDSNNLDEVSITIVDSRSRECNSCGENFLDTSLIGTCEDCERKYNDN